jgi:hypothetical protein
MAATVATFRRLALSLPEATEGAHMGHPDFRVRNKIFASLGAPDKGWGVVKLTPEQQEVLMGAEPGIFKPAAGAWGRRGWTHVHLAAVDGTTLRSVLAMAWRNTAPKTLARTLQS